ncbi:hypothetical protein JOC59_000481 [Weissella beninensis]|uniref:Uncharacterized protein n=1 Tax=Periweissella beninensis TaxID=504936 RepID=A0ABT0VJ02_9LACO|nr:hypothetical protein [Periweissella beninensis]MBM7543777.1 hypothetical protein [Periweissella beninensis]MCM2436839.1 hypothetical protein [Periweissella beninensis]
MEIHEVYPSSYSNQLSIAKLVTHINARWPDEYEEIQFARAIDVINHRVYGFRQRNYKIEAYRLSDDLYLGILDILNLETLEKTSNISSAN